MSSCVGEGRALGFRFFQEFLEDIGVQRLPGDQLLELSVLFFEQTQPFDFIDLEAAKLLLPLVEGRLAGAVASAQLGQGRVGLRFRILGSGRGITRVALSFQRMWNRLARC